MSLEDAYNGLTFKVAMDAGKLAWNTSGFMSRGTTEEREIYRLSMKEMEDNPFRPDVILARMVHTVMQSDMDNVSIKGVVQEMREQDRRLGLDSYVDIPLGMACEAYAGNVACHNPEKSFDEVTYERVLNRAMLVTAGLNGHDSVSEAKKELFKNYSTYNAAYSNNRENVERLARGEPIRENSQERTDEEGNSQKQVEKVENFQARSQSDSHDESVHAHQTLNAESMKSPQMAESNPMVTNIKEASKKLMDASEKTESPVGRFALQKVSRALNDIGDGILHHVKDMATQWAQKVPDMEASVQRFAPKPLHAALSSVFAGIREHFGMDVTESRLAGNSVRESRDAGNQSGPSPFD